MSLFRDMSSSQLCAAFGKTPGWLSALWYKFGDKLPHEDVNGKRVFNYDEVRNFLHKQGHQVSKPYRKSKLPVLKPTITIAKPSNNGTKVATRTQMPNIDQLIADLNAVNEQRRALLAKLQEVASQV